MLSFESTLFPSFIQISNFLFNCINTPKLFSLLAISFFKCNNASLNFFRFIFSCIKISALSDSLTFFIKFMNANLYSWVIPNSSHELSNILNSSLKFSSIKSLYCFFLLILGKWLGKIKFLLYSLDLFPKYIFFCP